MKKLKYDPLNIVICGIGGQGNVLASELVASTMTELGYHVAVGETYGASQRGGSVMSHVRISETEELGVLISHGEGNFIIGFEPLETLRIAREYSNSETVIIYDPRPVYPLGVLKGTQVYPEIAAIKEELKELSAKAYAVPVAEITLETGNSKAANIALLGAFSRLPGAPLSSEELREVLTTRFKGEVLEMNLKAFDLGCKAIDDMNDSGAESGR